MTENAPEEIAADEATAADVVIEGEAVEVVAEEEGVSEEANAEEAAADQSVEESGDEAQHLRLLEALIFASATMLDEDGLAERLPKGVNVRALLAELAEIYANRGVNLVKLAGGWTFRTAPDLKDRLKIETQVSRKLSRAAVETLAIIAYHQPVTRAEIEAIRGVGLSKGTLDLLFEQGWIEPRGRRRAPGKPVTWGSTPYFLEHFGLGALDDLPGFDELKAAGLLDANANITVYRPEEGDLPLEPTEDEDAEPLTDDGAAGTAEATDTATEKA